jgi:hypothetical protein
VIATIPCEAWHAQGSHPSPKDEHSAWCRMIVNFSQNITSESLKISHPIF